VDADGRITLPPGARAMLRAPDAVTRTIAATEADDVRASYVAEVLDGAD
jgi:hypothetical protein